MTEAFHESGSENLLLVVLTDDKGLAPPTKPPYRKLVERAARGHARCLDVAGFRQHAAAAIA